MTSRYITTDGEFNDLIPTYVDGDDVYLQDGVSCTMAHSPNFRIDSIYIQDASTLIIDGANGTAPIHVPNTTYHYIYPGSFFNTTEGWHTIGTSDGSPSQVLDLTNYLTGGGGPSDILTDLSGIQAELGSTYRFTEGTGTMPVLGQWLHKTGDEFYNIFGYIHSAGTTAGTGYITTKYTYGTIAENDEITAMGIVERNGPSLERFWTGTVAGAPEIATDIWQPMFNNRLQGTNCSHRLHADTPTGLNYHMAGGTNLTLGDGVHGTIPVNGARVRAPGVLISRCSAAQYTAGTTADTHIERQSWLYNLIYYGGINLNSVNMTGWTLNGQTLSTCNLTNYSCQNSVYLQSSLFPNFTFDTCVFGAYYPTSSSGLEIRDQITGGTIVNCIMPKILPGSGGVGLKFYQTFCASTDPIYINDNIILAPYIDNTGFVVTHLSTSNMHYDNNTIIGYMDMTNSVDNSMLRTKHSKHCDKTNGTDTSTYECINGSTLTGFFDIKGWEHIYNFVPGGSILEDPFCFADVTIRNIGSPDAPLRLGNLSDGLFDLDGQHLDILDIARVFLDKSVKTHTNYINLNNSSDSRVIWRDVITPDSTAFITRGNNVSYQGASMNGDRPTTAIYNLAFSNARAGTHSHSGYQHEGFGGIFATFTPPTDTSNPYSVISGALTFDTRYSLKMFPGDIVEFELDFFAKGLTDLSGTIAYCDASTSWGSKDWSGTVRTYFQYDTGGTGFNGTWGTVATEANWTGLDIQIDTGIKLKYRFECDTEVSNMYAFATQFHTSDALQRDWHSWQTIDQTVTTITLENIVTGSTYWIYDNTTSELLASGSAGASTVTHEENNLADGTQLKIRVRSSSGSPKYLPFETFATTASLAANVFVSQVEDTIAS